MKDDVTTTEEQEVRYLLIGVTHDGQRGEREVDEKNYNLLKQQLKQGKERLIYEGKDNPGEPSVFNTHWFREVSVIKVKTKSESGLYIPKTVVPQVLKVN